MINYRECSDAELLEILQSDGDVISAFTVIYDRYWIPLVLHAKRMLGDTDLAKDTVQEMFTFLFQHREIEIKTSLSSYIYKAVRNRVLDNIKHSKVKLNYAEDFYAYIKNVGEGELADEQICLKEVAKAIESEIEKMPPKMREIFVLSRKQYLSQKDIAEKLDLSENTVNNQIQRGIKRLRKNNLLHTSIFMY